MSSFSSETLHPRARSAPLPSLCMSPSTQVAADQRAVGNRHHLFNRTVAPASWGLVRSVGFAAQSVRVRELEPRWLRCLHGKSLSPKASLPHRGRDPRTLMPGRHGGISPVTDDGNHGGCARARPPRGDRALYRYRPDLRSVCAAPRCYEADAGDA